MAIRSGMIDLVSQYRSYVQESGTTIFSDDRIQQILDSNVQHFTQLPLYNAPYYLNGTVVYYDYYVDKTFLEGTATSTVRVYNTSGTTVTNYSSDFINGRFIFNVDTRGSAYYITGKSFNFFKAVSEGWKEKAAYYSTQFDFKVEGREYKKSQLVKSCLDMAKEFESKSTAIMHSIDRGDMFGSELEND